MSPPDPLAWLRDDPRESFLAPQINLHQALTASGRTVSGAGESAAEARARALSETAEFAALEGPGAGQLPRAFLPTRDGIAAGSDWAGARSRALLEACERRAVSDWWLGQDTFAKKLSAAWLAERGLMAWLDVQRAGADLQRITELWHVTLPLPAPAPIALVIARSMGRTGQSPMLGYGCATGVEAAARKALREVLLMEICVMDDYVARVMGAEPSDLAPRRQMADFARRLPTLLPKTPEVAPEGPLSAELFEGDQPACALIDWLSGPVAFTRLTVPGHAGDVAVCQPLGARPVLMPGPGSPFVRAERDGRGEDRT